MNAATIGITDIDKLMKMTPFEFDALADGYEIRMINQRADNAELAMFIRYTMNESKVNMRKMIDVGKLVRAVTDKYKKKTNVNNGNNKHIDQKMIDIINRRRKRAGLD